MHIKQISTAYIHTRIANFSKPDINQSSKKQQKCYNDYKIQNQKTHNEYRMGIAILCNNK